MRCAVVTGAAQGMGRSHAEHLAAAGFGVVLVDLNGVRLRQATETTQGGVPVVADVTHAEDIERVVDTAVQHFGGVDVLVNNAGGALYPATSLLDTTDEQWEAVHGLNFKAQWLCARGVVPSMRARGAGRIINIASNSAWIGDLGVGAYLAAKSGVIGLTRALARELGPDGITVNAIAPGLIKIAEPKPSYTPAQFDSFAESVVARQQIKRVGLPADVSAAVMFFASDQAGFITGQTLLVDGGAIFH